MKLSAPRFNTMLNTMGQTVLWRRADDCPCRDPHSGAARRDCPACHGLGVSWRTPITATLALAGQKVQAQLADWGEYQSGDVAVTIPTDSPAFDAGQPDRFTLLDTETPWSLVVRQDSVLRERVVRVDRATVFLNGQVVEIDPPVVSDEGVMTWTVTPPVDLVALSLVRHPEYFLAPDYLQDRSHFGGTRYPRRAVLRKWDLYGRH